jgi:hypothetical protein
MRSTISFCRIVSVSVLLSLVVSAASSVQPLFEELVPSKSGIAWVHDNARSEKRYLPETMGPGAAFFDYDNDGWMDLYLVSYGPCDFFTPAKPLQSVLYRNNRDGSFTVSPRKRVSGNVFGMGVAASDYDNNGHVDLLLTVRSFSCLYHNNGDGTFADVSQLRPPNSQLDDQRRLVRLRQRWPAGSVSLQFCRLRIGPAHFAAITSSAVPITAFHACLSRHPATCFTTTAMALSRTSATVRHLRQRKALGVVATDINNDGRMDLFVANDTVQNFLFLNRGEGKFEETGLMAEVAYSEDGRPRSGMGVDSADFNGDGWPDLFVANVDQEKFSLYQNNKDDTFRDQAMTSGVGQATLLLSGWGLKFFDFDNDGSMDLFLANGRPDDMVEINMTKVTYKEPLLLFRQENRKFVNISADAGPAFQRQHAARGMALGDYDNDGRYDVVVANNGEAPLLPHNIAGKENHWLGIRLVGTQSTTDAIGARLTWSVGGVQHSKLKTEAGAISRRTIRARSWDLAVQSRSIGWK